MTFVKSAICSPQSAILAFLAIACVFATNAFASPPTSPPNVVLCDGAPFAAELAAIGDGAVTFRLTDGAERAVHWNELVRWSHPVVPRSGTTVHLIDGSQLIVVDDWANEATLQWSAASLAIETAHFGRVEIPTRLVDSISFANELSPPHFGEGLGEGHATDVVLLTNGDRLTGKITKLDNRELVLEIAGETVTLPTSRIAAVLFGQRASGGWGRDAVEPPASPQLTVGLDDGSLLYTIRVVANAVVRGAPAVVRGSPDPAQVERKALELETVCGLRLKGQDSSVAAAKFLQALGGRAVYLSDLEPADYRHTPYLEIPWQLVNDRNVSNGPLQAGGRRYLKGLGLHSASRLTYRLDGTAKRFAAEVALDDSAGEQGSVEFRVYLARGGQWQEAYRSDTLRGGDAPQSIAVDLEDAGALMLVVDYADRGDELDHADWLDARLIK